MLLKREKKSQRARQTETTSVSSTHREKYSQQRAATNHLDLSVHDWLCYAQKESKAHDFQVLVKERTVFIFKPWLFFTPSSLSSK